MGDQDPLSPSRHGPTRSTPDILEPARDYSLHLSANLDAVFPDDPQWDSQLSPFLDENIFVDPDTITIEELFQSCNEKPEEDDQKPQKGMMFSTLSEAEEFYYRYAKKTGFTVRKGKIYQPNGTLKWRRLLCSCEGFRGKNQSKQGAKYQRLETRTGCRALMQVTLEKEKWVITKVHLDHNHRLNNSNQSLDGLSDKVENKGNHPRQTTEEHSAGGHWESSSMAKPSDEVEVPCGNQLPMEQGSLPVAGSASFPTFIPTPTLPSATKPSCLQDKPSGGSGDEGKESKSLGRVNKLSHVDDAWEHILTNYGDITATCTLKSSEFAAFVKQSILKIVELLQNNTVRDLSDEDISTTGRLLSDLERVEVKVDWLRSRFVQVVDLFNYVRAKDGQEENIRRRIADLNQALEQERTNLQKLQTVPGWLTIHDKLAKGLF